jgi:hypothetical protein
MPSNIILPNINKRSSEATFTLQPRNSGYTAELNQGGSLSSTHSELTPVTFTHATDSHQHNATALHASPGNDYNNASGFQPSEWNLDEQTCDSGLVDTHKELKPTNTCDSQQLEQDLIANAAVDQAYRQQGLQPIQSPMIDESTEVFRQSTNLVLASVVNEALEKGG